MKDLEIIEEIEILLDIEIEKRDEEFYFDQYPGPSCFYNENGNITSLSLELNKEKNLNTIISLLAKIHELDSLSLSYEDEIEISSINALQNIRHLSISGDFNSPHLDIENLIHNPALERLNIFSCELINFEMLSSLNLIKEIHFRYTNIPDLRVINSMLNLEILSIENTSISDIQKLTQCKSLIELSLRGCKEIKDFSAFEKMQQLQTLDLSRLNLIDINFLATLTNLEILNLNENKIRDCTILRNLRGLRNLTLYDNEIEDISAISFLKSLDSINLGNNNISNISAIGYLEQLKSLWLIDNNIKNAEPIIKLKNLRKLSLGGNEISDISFLKNLINIEMLHLQDNKIVNASPLIHLSNLKILFLHENKINEIDFLKGRNNLENVVLNSNLIINLPEWITKLGLEVSSEGNFLYANGQLTLDNNPIKSPPLEIVKKGNNAINRYFQKIKEEGLDYIYEAKLIFVGEGSAGKTSLKQRIIREDAELPQRETRTRGIEISDWELSIEHSQKHIAHMWDFGGQDVYYPVHRFFITENSVFVLLASTRQTHHNFDYWIPTIFQFAGNSPIILGQTCHDGNKVHWNDLDIYFGNRNFNLIKTNELGYSRINLLDNNNGLAEIKKIIAYQIEQLPHYGRGVPKSWVALRSIFYDESKQSACITFEKFKEICRNVNPTGFANEVDVLDYCQFLHDIGVVLWYATNEELKNWVILQPDWAMNAVYRIIDDKEIQQRTGNIIANDFIRLWDEVCYEGRHTILKKMLEVFKIAFPKKHISGNYIIPARLISIPSIKKWDPTHSILRLRYEFEFMPRGIINQISAELSRLILKEDEVWNNAVNLYAINESASCQLFEDFYNRKISISANGSDARSLLFLVINTMKNITDEYKGVDPLIYVPCACEICKNSPEPESFRYDKLLDYLSKNRDSVVCQESLNTLSIDELLYKVGLQNPEKNIVQSSKSITIFLASSFELKKDREEFEIFISRENKALNKKGVFLNLEIWEDFIDSVSPTRSQDEYNKAVLSCDIFVSLFFTKVGIYTNEEFDTAYGQFIKNGKPLIYTYFKEGTIDINITKSNDLLSKEKFQEKLKAIGHFPTNYKNIDDLKYKFKMQLDKILP